MMLRCAIVDDEPLALSLLESYVNKTPFLQLVGKYSSAVQAMKELPGEEVDLLFLDIQMPELNGLEFSKMVDPHTRIVFTTAFGQYAIDGYRVNALDYLLKPIDPEELVHAVDKAVQVILRKQENKRMQNLLQNVRALDKQKKIALSVADKVEFVEIGSIIRCESESNYTTFYLKSGEKLIVSKTLKEFDELLTPYNFLRVHQSHLINLDEIRSFIKTDGGYIRMKDGSTVSISRQRRNYVLEVLKQL